MAKHQATSTLQMSQERIVDCENCGKKLGVDSGAINYWTGIGVLGHPTITNVIACCGEHWACSFACWWTIAQECLKHNYEEMVRAHLEIPESIHHTAAKDIVGKK
jgi:hypothetical protein